MPTLPKIIALGTGTADTVKYAKTAFFIQDEAINLLIDTGGGSEILARLDHCGIALNEIQHVFITHKHIDHIFGIFWILRFRGAAIHSSKAPNLTIYASEENIGLIKQVSGLFLKKKVLELFDTKIMFIAVNESSTALLDGGWAVKFFDIQSEKENQLGCHITFPHGKTMAFIGDEPYRDAIFPFCENVDYLFHDAYCLKQDREAFAPHKISHSTAQEAAANAQRVKAKNLILFHTEDKATFGKRKALYTEEARKEYSGNIFVPDDGDIIEIK